MGDSFAYQRFEDASSTTLRAGTSEISFIRYQNRRLQRFDNLMPAKPATSAALPAPVNIPQAGNVSSGLEKNTPEHNYLLGAADAKANYIGYKGAGTACLAISIIATPVVGLITAIVTAAAPPRQFNLSYPSDARWQSNDYRHGYQTKAASMKSSHAFQNLLIGTGIFLLGAAVIRNRP